MKFTVFDIFGEYAHFKKFYTTSSPLTFPFPPPSTVAGMLAAICGIDKKEYLEIFTSQRFRCAIRIISPIKKIRFGINHINTKGNAWRLIDKKNHEPRTQIRTEFIKSPRYRIYFHHTDSEIFQKITNYLQNHWIYYTFALGLSELLGDFSWVGILDGNELKFENQTSIHSVIPLSQIAFNQLKIEEGRRYFRERVPVAMTAERIVTRYEDVLFEAGGNDITLGRGTCIGLENGDNIILF